MGVKFLANRGRPLRENFPLLGYGSLKETRGRKTSWKLFCSFPDCFPLDTTEFNLWKRGWLMDEKGTAVVLNYANFSHKTLELNIWCCGIISKRQATVSSVRIRKHNGCQKAGQKQNRNGNFHFYSGSYVTALLAEVLTTPGSCQDMLQIWSNIAVMFLVGWTAKKS